MTPTPALSTPLVANLLSCLFIYLHKYLQISFKKKNRTDNIHAQAPLPCIRIWVLGWKEFGPSMKLITPVFVCSWPWKGDSYVMNWTSIIMIASSLTLSTENLSKTRRLYCMASLSMEFNKWIRGQFLRRKDTNVFRLHSENKFCAGGYGWTNIQDDNPQRYMMLDNPRNHLITLIISSFSVHNFDNFNN